MEKTREQVMAERKLRKAEKKSKKKPTTDVADGNKNVKNDEIVGKKESPPTKLDNNIDVAVNQLSDKVNELHVDTASTEKVTSANKASNEVKEDDTDKPPVKQNDETDGTKTKSQLRAERRAKQEAQRAAKAANQKNDLEKVSSDSKASIKEKKSVPVINSKTADEIKAPKRNNTRKIQLFSHLCRDSSLEKSKILASSTPVHRAVIRLGVQYKTKVIIGSNARVVALLDTLKQVISDYETPAEKDFSRGFELVLASTTTYLRACRPISEPMENALKHIKRILSQFPNNIKDDEAKAKLINAVDVYITEQIDTAGEAICIMVQRKISEDDVILTFGYSSLIERILIETFQIGVKFRVIIVDAGPLYEGKELLRRLAKRGLNCIYVLISATSYIMKEANKVLLGAHALLTNGYVMSRAGSSQVALIAKSCNVPVLVCCETHKFSERVQTDALVYNELANSDELMDPLKFNKYAKPIALMYEVTPSDLVTAVVTELAILPCTSVPVVLRVKPSTL